MAIEANDSALSRPLALLLTPVRPDAYGNGLARRAWHWAVELSRNHELLTIVVATGGWAKEGSTEVPGRLEMLDVIRQPSAWHPGSWIDPAPPVQAAFKALLPATAPHRIVVFRLYLHPIASLLPGEWQQRAEIDCDDWESVTRRSLARIALRQGEFRQAWSMLLSSLAYARLERRLLPRYWRVHFSAGEDAAAFRPKVPGLDVVATPNRIADTSVPVEPITGAVPPRLFFVGSLNWPPNEDAVLWFARKVAPLLQREVPGLQISIAGRTPPERIRNLRQYGVQYVGAPSDLAAAYRDVGIAIVPMRAGGGSKLKLLEAWLFGRPVVATSSGARGFGAEHGRHLLVADTPEEFASACVRLLREPALAASLVREGKALLVSKFLLPVAPLRKDR